MIKLVVIGCGAVVEKFHLPALAKIKTVKIEALVDIDFDRLKQLKKLYKVPIITNNYHNALKRTDFSLIALPNFLHAPVAIDCLNQGNHVFCEKPMAINFSEANKMIRASIKNRKKLAIGLTRRQFKINQEIKTKLENNYFGKIKSFKYEEGVPFNWPLHTLYAFNKKQAGGGVLIDMGAHVIDLIVWLFGQPDKIEYFDNSYGGIESDCLINLKIGSIKGRIELSRSRTLTNIFKIKGEKKSLSIPAADTGKESFEDGIYNELFKFIKAIENNNNDYISGQEAIKSIKTIDYCYRNKKQLKEPWNEI